LFELYVTPTKEFSDLRNPTIMSKLDSDLRSKSSRERERERGSPRWMKLRCRWFDSLKNIFRHTTYLRKRTFLPIHEALPLFIIYFNRYECEFHKQAMFDSVQIVRMHTLAWEFSKKDIIGGKEIQFLAIKIGSVRGPQALESQSGKNRCFKTLFGRDCESCV
jgi:hypothetical protein